MNRKTVILGTMLATLSFGALAEGINKEEDDRAMSFDTLDKNKDGALEEMEVMSLQDDGDFEGVRFETLDKDDNGKVERKEWVKYFSSN